MATISIVGGAITGPSAALTLARDGHDVTVYEQRPEDGLYSAGVLGITGGNWSTLQRSGVQLSSAELGNRFGDFSHPGIISESPFRLIAWVDLHRQLTAAARDAGARFRFSTRVNPDDMDTEFTFDAGGIFSAARRLRSQYSGFAIYRGTSPRDMPGPLGDFLFYRMGPSSSDGYLTVSQTHYGASWAFFLPRPMPMHPRTVTTATPPAETHYLPEALARIIRHTPDMIVSYMSDWEVPEPRQARDRTYHRFTIGDANGPVRPVTTSGANLAVIVGMHAETFVSGSHTQINNLQRSLLERRRYDISLGRYLEAPEIGGEREDDDYQRHHRALFQYGER